MVESLKQLSQHLKRLPDKFMRRPKPPFPVVKTPLGGRIALASCPGAHGDFEEDIQSIQNWGATLVVSLVEEHELDKAGALQIGDTLQNANIQWRHMPIRDQGVPHQEIRHTWLDIKPMIRYRLTQRKERILLHCWAGAGRAGMIAAKLLMQCGMTSSEAVTHIRKVKPDAIDTYAQQQWLDVQSW